MRSGSRLLAALLSIFVGAAVFAENSRQSLGVETAQARAAKQKFDEPIEAKIPILKQRLADALRANGYTDPEARMREVDATLAEAIKANVDKTFAAKGAENPKQFCELVVPELGMLESSFRFTDYYERIMAL